MMRNLILCFIASIASNFISAQPRCAVKNDFTFIRNTCSPLSVSFLTTSTGYSSISWDFGDTRTAMGTRNPTNIYTNTGSYQVKMIQNYGSCIDTVIKQIVVDLQTDDQLVQTSDTTICSGTTKQLLTRPGLNFCWNPTTFLDNPRSSNPITSTNQNITYYFTSESVGNNLIVNGNFNAGNTGFISAYNYVSVNTTEAEYFVGSNPQAWNVSTVPCTDHTTGTGNMMLVNGAPVANVKVWTQTISVTPNTNYAFSTWVQAIYSVNPAQLQFYINGNDVGSLITASLPPCTWSQFYTTWNSGSNTTINISIVNKNTFVQGNDFALDDISFSPVFLTRDSVKIIVEPPPLVITNNSLAICEGTSVQLNTTGASIYSWTPATGLSNPAIGNPLASPTVSTRYTVTGKTVNGCSAQDIIDIAVNPKPTITKSSDIAICAGASTRLTAGGGTSFSWSPSGTLDNASSPTPIATPSSTTKYLVTVTDANACTNEDSIKITVNPKLSITKSNDTTICSGASVQLIAGGGVSYSWSPGATLNNVTLPNPIATPLSTTKYYATVTSNACTGIDSITITVNSKPTVTKSPDVITCLGTPVQLNAGGGASYSWSPATTLNNASSPNPVATPLSSTKYFVTVSAANTCTNIDSINVIIKSPPNFTITPTVNVCPADSIRLNASGGDLYSWQPAASLNDATTASPNASPAITTTYFVHITDTVCHNDSTLSTTVSLLPLPIIKASKSNDIDCSNDQSKLNVMGGVRYTWTPTATLNNPNIASPVARPLTTTQYKVKGIDASGCINYDSVVVNISTANKGHYLMPNAFTPNDDGRNDCYGVAHWGKILELEFSIYNRWGEKIFHTKDPSGCWNGRYKGLNQDSGIFVYMIKARTICENYIFRKGTFVLIR